MAKIITMGEIMLRLSTPNNEKFIQADEFDVNYGGGEANVRARSEIRERLKQLCASLRMNKAVFTGQECALAAHSVRI